MEGEPQAPQTEGSGRIRRRYDRRPGHRAAAAEVAGLEEIWGIVILALGCLLSLGVLGSIGSGQMAQARAEMGDDTVAQFTYTFFNLAVFLLIPLGIWLLARRPKR